MPEDGRHSMRLSMHLIMDNPEEFSFSKRWKYVISVSHNIQINKRKSIAKTQYGTDSLGLKIHKRMAGSSATAKDMKLYLFFMKSFSISTAFLNGFYHDIQELSSKLLL